MHRDVALEGQSAEVLEMPIHLRKERLRRVRARRWEEPRRRDRPTELRASANWPAKETGRG